MYLVSLSHPHNAASALEPELSPSLECEHEVRREVTLQVKHCFGQVDDSDGRWEMDGEKVVRQVGLGILRQYKIGFRPHSSVDFNFVYGWYLLYLQSDPILEDELMTK